MNRREAIFAGLGLGLLESGIVRAAPDARPRRVVRMTLPTDDPNGDAAVRKSWAEFFAPHGFRDGDNLSIEVVRPKTVQLDVNPEYDAIAQRVVDSRPDVILVHMVWLRYMARFTDDIPIVFSGMIEPEYHRLIDTARRPGRNITGALFPLFEVQAKRIALAKEMYPKARRVAVVCGRGGVLDLINERTRETARSLGMEGFALPVADNREKGRVIGALREARVDIADFISNEFDPATLPDMMRFSIVGTASDASLDGVLVSYDAIGIEETAAEIAARILRGEKVSTLPAQFPRHYRTTINLRTARALGITVPPAILVQAQEIYR